MAFIDIILLAALAAFLGYRLWLVLGTHSKDRPIRKRRTTEDDVVIPIRPRATSQKKETIVEKEEEDATAPQTDTLFLQGATAAFREIVQAYADGNAQTLKKLLDGPLLETFEDAIAKRKKSKKTLEVDIARVVSAEVLDKTEEKGEATITVRFVSEQCLVTRDTKGKVIAGDPDRFAEVIDIWTFARPIKSSNPNWKLVATQIPEAS
jgi:predicted lipid-binding transport protein (Tim44 family)